MKKIFSLFAAVLFAGSMMAGSYTIAFKDAGEGKGDSSTSLSSTTVSDYIAEGAEYVSAIAASGKVYNGQEGYGLKFGNSSGSGSITLTLAAAVTPTSIVMNASPWSATEGSGLLQDSTFATTKTGAKGTFGDFTYVYDGATQVTTIVLGTAAKRGYVKYITINYADAPAGDTWTVAGSSTVAFGTSWDPTNTANDMVKQNDGTFKWEKENLELAAGSVNFKVVKNHSWDEAYPSQDYNLAIDADGIYTITITFEPDNSNNVSALATKTGEAVVVPTVVMHGTFVSSDWADTEAFATTEDKKTASLKLTLAAGDIEFGLKLDGAWKANGATITRENASTSLASGSGDMHLTADVDGEYTFTYTYETQTLEVTFPVVLPDPTNCAEAREAALSVSANNEEYNGGKEYTIEGFVTSIAYAWKDGSMSFWMADTKEGGNVLEAFKCAIEKEEDAVRVGDKVAVTGKLTKYNTTPEFAAGCTVEIKERAEVEEPENLGEKTIAEFLELKNTKDTCVLTGKVINIANDQYGNLTIEDATGSLYVYGVLTPAGESKKFNTLDVAVNDVLTIKATYNEYNGNPQAKNAIFVSREKAIETAVDNATVAGKAQKMIIDGQLFIIRDGVMFNANGAAVK